MNTRKLPKEYRRRFNRQYEKGSQLERYLQGEMSKEEERKFERWLEEAEAHSKEMERWFQRDIMGRYRKGAER